MRILLQVIFVTSCSLAEPSSAAPVDSTIERGLAFLVQDALAWKSEHNCASCHHAALVVWSMREAKARGHTVDEKVLEELTTWIAESGDGKTSVARPPGKPEALNVKAVQFALALAADPAPSESSRAGLKRLLGTVKEDQTENGSWTAWPETRPPIFGSSDDSMSALATLALLSAFDRGDESAREARDRGIQWLKNTPTDDDPQSVAIRLVVWQRLGRPRSEWAPMLDRIKARQKEDGGWSQTVDGASDAWATGQALYALGQAGLSSRDPEVSKAQQFLSATQKEDGSWPMQSRPTKPGGEGSKSLRPITGAGSAWAILGLVWSH